MPDRLLDRILQVLEKDVLDLTEQSVAAGNKIFGAAILYKKDLELVVAGTNEETRNPLLHGEVSALNHFWALPQSQRPLPSDCLFVSTHEPCSMCLSAITWSGFDNFYYLFSYEDSRDAFSIPHDLKIMHQVFGLEDGEYRRHNDFWTSHSLPKLADAQSADVDREQYRNRIDLLRQRYAELSTIYQSGKNETDIPLA